MKKSFILLCFLLVNAVIILISSCKEPDTVGLEVQPSSDRLTYNYIDTFKVNTISAIDNKIYTNSISLNLLGSTNDPVFGSTTASIYTQFRMPNENFSFPAKSTLDNNPAVLTLAYKKYNGNPNSSLNFNVYEIINNLSTSHNYYSDTNIAVSSNAIAKISITPNPSGNMVISGTDTTYLLNINLPADFAKKFLNSSSSNFTDNATFTNFFKGLYITTDKVNSNGSILYIDLLSTYTKLSINYKDSLSNSQSLNLIVDQNSARFSNFNHYSYSQATNELKNQIFNSAKNQNISYLQSLGGIKVKLTIPYLKNLTNKLGKISVNKAELVIVPDSTYLVNPPQRITVTKINSDGSSQIISDQTNESAYYNGYYNSTKKEYRLNISRYIQSVINSNSSDYGLNLLIYGNAVNVSNMILIDNSNRIYPKRTHLELFYTKTK